jgi:hypothetical protein
MAIAILPPSERYCNHVKEHTVVPRTFSAYQVIEMPQPEFFNSSRSVKGAMEDFH